MQWHEFPDWHLGEDWRVPLPARPSTGFSTISHDVGGGLAPHPAAAADDHQLLPGEDGHGLRPVGLVRVTVQVLEPVPARVHFQWFLSVRW